jgi:hypothetical protein
MSQDSPYPRAVRAYWKGYSREQDKRLAKKLFYGTTVRDKTGRDHHRYLPEDGPEEREGFEALRRLLFYGWNDDRKS